MTRSEWSPHIWLGCGIFALLRLFHQGRWRFGWDKLPFVPVWIAFAIGHTFLRYAQRGLTRHAPPMRHAPIFILGHWRSGTTLLHELLVLDPRHGSPTTLQCMDPMHFLLTGHMVDRYFAWVLPEKRMMDNMAVGWSRPQEDEFALVLMGAASPYARIAFPNTIPFDAATLDVDPLPARRRAGWKRVLRRFLDEVYLSDPRRMVLKSPPHTCRIPVLLEMFPDARFIHIVRNPVEVFSSTVNLWKRLWAQQAVQTPTFAGLEEEVFETYLHVHRRLEATRGLVASDRFHELRYEDLTRDPVGELRTLYERLGLPGFDGVRPRIEAYLVATATYEKNKWQPSPEEVRRIEERWGEVMDRYGYRRSTASDAA